MQEFIEWIDYCYGNDYEERRFDEALIPHEKVIVDTKRIKEQESLLDEKDAEIEALRKKIEAMSAQYTAEKEQHQHERSFEPEDLSEFKTRKIYIDVDVVEGYAPGYPEETMIIELFTPPFECYMKY